MTEDQPDLTIEYLGDAKAYGTWSTNRDRSMNYHERSRIKSIWRDGAYYAGRQWRIRLGFWEPMPRAVIQLQFYTPGAAKVDPHNFCGTVLKAAVDGLVLANFWPDDTSRWVGHRESIIEGGKPFLPRLHFFTGTRPWEV